ncbi:MAG TPA: LytTR family DNA-binding domain-containing protein [Terracidiphilus sp.]|nr:LytTR family DNA-binding domain-containing protein [Terracidiphilus sp.]
MRAILVDDERLARQELRRLLSAHDDVEIAAEARNADEAEDLLDRLAPDLLFLDIQMPGRSGLEMLERFPDPPQTILTTAFDRYAVRGFELNAVDYLLKPIVPERLSEALRRVRERLNNHAPAFEAPAPAPLHQVFVRDGERCWLVPTSEIALLRSEGNYTRVVFGTNQPLIPRSLAQIEPRLDPAVFFRANRAEIINLKRVAAITPEADGYTVALRNGPSVVVSRRQAKLLRDTLAL